MKEKDFRMQIFLWGGTILIGIVAIALFFEPDIMNAYLFGTEKDTFMDYYHSVASGTCQISYLSPTNIYPPVCWLLYYILLRYTGNCKEVVALEGNHHALKMYRSPVMVYTVVLIACILIFIWILSRWCKQKKAEREWIIALLIFSVPFLFMVERGNIVIFALLGSMAFFACKDSEKWWVRDFGYFCLALAAAIKLYPAFLGLILLKDKRYKETLRLFLYGIAVFILPFLFACTEGLGGIPLFLGNLTGFNFAFLNTAVNEAAQETGQVELVVEVVDRVVNDANRIGFAAFMEHLFYWLGVDKAAVVTLANKLAMILGVLGIIAAFLTEKKWQAVFLFASVCIGIQSRGYTYTLTFAIIPLILFLNSEYRGRLDYIYLILQMLIFFPLPLGWTEHIHEDAYYIHYRSFSALQMGGALWLLTIICILEIGIRFVNRRKER